MFISTTAESSSRIYPHPLSGIAGVALWNSVGKKIDFGSLEGEIWTTDSEIRIYTSGRHQVCLEQQSAACQSVRTVTQSTHITSFPHYPISVLLQYTIPRNGATVTQRAMWTGQSWMILNTRTVITTCANRFNLFKPTGYVMHHQFNIQQLYVLPTLYLYALYLSENKQRLVPLTA